MNLTHEAPLAIGLIGLVMGMRHATDPDHVIAVTTIVSRERGVLRASAIGASWGVGHTVTVLAVGTLIIVGKLAIPARVGLAMELAVALLLILLGLEPTHQLLRRAIARVRGRGIGAPRDLTVHTHGHRHGQLVHRHQQVHAGIGDEHATGAPHEHRIPRGIATRFSIGFPRLRAFAVGLVHGLAGSAAIALLALSAIPEARWAALYLVIFCGGTIIGMGLITMAIVAPLALARGRLAWLHQGLVSGAGLVSFSFGAVLAYQIVVIEGLLGAAPLWVPH